MTGRSQFALISEGEATQMGVQAYQGILAEAKLSTDTRTVAMVERVGRRIAQVTDRRMTEAGREPFQWEFKVIDDPKMANAFALPGGKVAVYTGILPITQDENGLAVVMGHEVAHAYAQHGRKRVSENVVAQLGFGVAEAFLGGDQTSESSQLIMAALGAGYQLGVQLPFSRGDESAADEIGLYLMAEAGYDPRAAAPFWERMQSMGGQTPPEFLSTHPDPANRIARIQELLPEALEIYERSKTTPEGAR
jgi:predicted Zn-dependent protease